MKKFLKLVPAFAMLLVAAILVSTSTYAWFSMNNRVTVTGMTIRTKVNNNLLISATNSDPTFVTELTQTLDATLEPVSTVDGTNFFYTVEAASDGQKINPLTGNGATTFSTYNENGTLDNAWTDAKTDAAAAGKGTAYDSTFNTTYSHTVGATSDEVYYGYVDYVFYLKATSTADDSAVVMTDCNLLYNGAAITAGEKAWRAGIFVQKVAKDAAGSGVGTLVSIIGLNGAAYFNDVAAASASTRSAVTTFGDDVVVDDDLDAGVTQRYKVVVRVWLEGEDSTCYNEMYTPLQTNDWSVDLEFKIEDDASNAITEIASVTPGP